MKRYSLWVKSLVFFLAVVTLLSVAVSGLGVVMAESMSMYTQDDHDSWVADQLEGIAQEIAYQAMHDYSRQISDCPEWLLEQAGFLYAIETVKGWHNLADSDFYYRIQDANGKTVYETDSQLVDDPIEFAFGRMVADYPEIVTRIDHTPVTETAIADKQTAEDPTVATTPSNVLYHENDVSYWDPDTGEEVFVRYVTKDGYQVNVGISRNYIGDYKNNGLSQNFTKWLFSVKYPLIAILAVSFLLFAAVFIFLMSLAGKDPKTGEANPRALNRLPLDLYLAAAVFITAIGCIGAYELLDELFYNDNYNVLITVLLCGCGIGVATVDLGFFTALAAQFKAPGRYWLHNSICGRVLRWLWKGCRFAARYLRKVFGMLPIIWEWIAAGGVLGIILVIICAGSASHWYSVFPLFLWCLAFAGVVTYCGYCYGTIRRGIQRMNEGDLNEKIDTKYLVGSFKTIAEDLNALADVVAIAAEKQLKSERMKTELITNVSHDIKTPLTSVINYVDLLQQPHTEEEGEQYLEVLSRQSNRLKKLVEDLMDMSKASSGNMAVNITAMDAVEAVNQALGEFSDKLDSTQLTPVFRSPDSQLHMLADGRLTWRVLSNILSNVVKYALPGTRVYIDLLRLDKSIVLSVKNISREELNITAEELTERFVRGDASRNTEGSGLGLNIAQSLMRLQHGNMEVTVDGDLFKVTLTFPAE